MSKNMEIALKRTYGATLGCDAGTQAGGLGWRVRLHRRRVFGESDASCGRVASVIPVDVAVPGCPPSPTRILQGILTAVTAAKDPAPPRA